MLSSIAGWVEEKATGYLKTGIQAGGTLAGNAVGSVGGLVEKAGQTAASGVQGGIGGLGSYINNYGETIKRSMSADGPVSTSAKKTAVKPSAPGAKSPSAQKALPSSQPAKRPNASVSQKALPAPSQKSPATSKPNTRSQAINKPNTRPLPSTKPGGPTAARAGGPVGVSKPASNVSKTMSKASTNASGKVVPSAKSRPRPTAGKAPTTRSTAASAKGGDILGIGNNIGNMNKTTGTQSQNKSQGGAARKPSAADPLAMGDLENIGKKK